MFGSSAVYDGTIYGRMYPMTLKLASLLATLWSMDNDCLAHYQANVFEWSDMSVFGL